VDQHVSMARSENRDRIRRSVGWWNLWRKSLLPAGSSGAKPKFLHTVSLPQTAVQRPEQSLQALQTVALQRAPVGLIVINDYKSIALVNGYAKQLLFGMREQHSNLKTIEDIDAQVSLTMTSAKLSSVLITETKRAFSVEAVSEAGRRLLVMVNNSDRTETAGPQVSVLTICDVSSVLERHLDCEENIDFVSHDMRFMLNSILLQADQLKGQLGASASPLSTNALTQISQRAKQTLALAEAFLEWRLLDRQKDVSMYPLDFVEIVASACEDANIQSRQAHVKIEFDCNDRILMKGNFSLLYRATLNLLNNAVRASQAGGRVWVGVSTQGSKICLSVRDGGSGFPADVLAMFGDDGRTRRSGRLNNGSRLVRGLGLQMTRKVAQIHGGTFHLSNASTQGSAIVELRLPTLSK
jgi:nitrogen fixation/metabolism regulation signal transduction histidine kinase